MIAVCIIVSWMTVHDLFDMKDLGLVKKILGMEIYRDRARGKLFLTQKSYIEKILSCFGMDKSKPISTPTSVSCKLSLPMSPQTEEELAYMSRVPYANAVGCLMYAIVCTRPDIADAVSDVSRFMARPGREHWQRVKRIFCYLRGTNDIGLVYV